MAKLKPIDFKFEAKAGEPLEFRSEVSVLDSTGEFSLTIPDVLAEIAKRIAISHRMYGVDIDRPRTHLRVTGKTLSNCKNFIKHVAEEYLKVEVFEEFVIVYSQESKVAYMKDADGTLYPNGTFCSKSYEDGKASWGGKLDATRGAEYYQIGLKARVFKKITYTRDSGSSTDYEWMTDTQATQLGPWAKKLNAIIGLNWPRSGQRDGYQVGRLPQLPYTEEGAMFFANMLMSMCQLADRLDAFFGNNEHVKRAIEQQANLLLPGPSKEFL
ncbi:serine acetyltransferase [Novimethylophilus kurashikiensis]|uniref:Serine acetyltransferase n=1 Tax=Novimethylophilus kurashikiensis TaxID=1825523 RepID=A0A2R5F8H0_9PROT|nr:hypothetical protein [Novimethylophilus kurashikiensis]GBG14542.1 serine acetyltransferase [Novimethylophilus kurashikiensis]